MNGNAVFTIVARNYIGLAKVLGASVTRNSDASFFIFVADESSQDFDPELLSGQQVLFSKEVLGIEKETWEQLAFKYNLVEFCTAIKAAAFQYLFGVKGYEKVIYLDPDVYVYSELASVFDQLNNVDIILTPHILTMETPFKGIYPDHLFLLNGTFNLGFIGLKNCDNANSILEWWHNRLLNEAFFDNDKGTATDQKWANLLPAFLSKDSIEISRDPGLNVAPWNFHERKIIEDKTGLYVELKDKQSGIVKSSLTFVHFSGFDYIQMCNGKMAHKNLDIAVYPDYSPVFDIYKKSVQESDFKKYINLGYTYSKFDNGRTILSLHRRIFRRLIEEGRLFTDPFTTTEGSFYSVLKGKGLIDKSVVSADSVTNKKVSNFDRKLNYVNIFFKFVKKIIGVRKYSILIRFLRRYFQDENQVFLVDKQIGKKLK